MSTAQDPRERDHARPDGGPDPDSLLDESLPIPSHAERARTLVQAARSATLCTLARSPEGYPYGSLVTFALQGGDPLLLISALAEHTKNLESDPRCSLMVSEAGNGNPLGLGRVTLIADAEKLESEEPRQAASEIFLETHSQAAGYVNFRDFAFWRLRVSTVRYIGGFGRMSFVSSDHWQSAESDPVWPQAQAIIDHMNLDHADVLLAATHAFTRAKQATDVRMVGVDRYGFELTVGMPSGDRPARVAFLHPIASAGEARSAMIDIAKEARRVLAAQ